MPKAKPEALPDLTSVRALVTSVTKLAKHLHPLTPNAIYRWFKVNRIPGEHIIKVANFYDVEIGQLIHLTGSELSAPPQVVLKPRTVLPALIEVREGTKTLAQAVEETGQSEKSLKLVLIHWGDEIKNLYETLQALDKHEISLDTACQQLGVKKYTLHGIRRKYGYAPGKVQRTRPLPTIKSRKALLRAAALDVIAGRASAVEAAKAIDVSSRNIFRVIEGLTPLSVSELSHFPTSFRLAYTDEIDKNTAKYAEKWLEIAKKFQLFIRKRTAYPKTPSSWKGQSLKRMLIGVLLGEGTVEEVAASRGADPDILAGLFTSELRPLDLTFDEVRGLGVNHQMALAELLLWQMDRKRTLK